jgi:glycosyltransferase involved in cell wall biosynthesis
MRNINPLSRAVIQYNCIPHYRARIFELLSQRNDVHFTVVADPEPDTPYLKTLSGDEGRAIRTSHAKTHIIRLPGIPDLYWQPQALKMRFRERPDTMIALGSPYSLTAWVLLITGKILRIPVLLWGQGLLSDETGPKWWIRRSLYRLAAGQLLYGEHARDLLRRKGFDVKSLYVVYNSLDFDAQREIAAEQSDEQINKFRRSLGLAQGEGLVVFTGRLQPVKRLDLLLEAVARLAQRGRRVHVALVGEGGERSNLEQLAARLNIADLVHFLGESYDERYLGLVVGASDLSVIPSGAGLSIMHALVFGTQVLIHDRVEHHFPEWEAVIEGKTGFFYRYDDVEDLAAKMEQAIFPVSVRNAMAEACKTVIFEKYNPHRQVETFVRAVCETSKAAGDRA